VSESNSNGNGEQKVISSTTKTFNADAFGVCVDCGSLLFLGNPHIVRLTNVDVSGQTKVAGLMCRNCVERHPDLLRQIQPVIAPVEMRPRLVKP
jgi:hypothetical protein